MKVNNVLLCILLSQRTHKIQPLVIEKLISLALELYNDWEIDVRSYAIPVIESSNLAMLSCVRQHAEMQQL